MGNGFGHIKGTVCAHWVQLVFSTQIPAVHFLWVNRPDAREPGDKSQGREATGECKEGKIAKSEWKG